MDVENRQRPGRSLHDAIRQISCVVLLFLLQTPAIALESPKPPGSLEVLPVFFVPQGETRTSPKERKLVLDHLAWTQGSYRKLLAGRSGFRIARREPLVIDGQKKLETYRQLPEMAAPEIVGEILDHLQQDRFSTPYVFVVAVTNRQDEFPVGGGRPLNGGLNEGGGIVVLSQFAFNSIPHIQSTLRHEIGHAFGLMHVDAYRYDMSKNDSIMSYNPKHHTRELTESATPGVLIPEDIRALAMNDRGFENLAFSAAEDVPGKYSLCPYVPSLPAMQIEGQPDYAVRLSSTSRDEYGSSIQNIIQNQILPSRGPEITYNPKFMWHTSPGTDGWVTLKVTFPRPLTLNQIRVHSEHSGQYHRAAELKVGVSRRGKLTELATAPIDSTEFSLKFGRTESQDWVISLRPGQSGLVCLRGLEFFDGEQEWFRPMVVLP
ncbi:MAG: hypothetical protein JWM11_2959 [Planctomycetaceae bacterium]|nr:hypothetical protein [Planctomycetaceae bacterium]